MAMAAARRWGGTPAGAGARCSSSGVRDHAAPAAAATAARFAGKVAVVTGAANGIGACVATRLAGEGARVALLDTDGGRGEARAAELRTRGLDALFLATNMAGGCGCGGGAGRRAHRIVLNFFGFARPVREARVRLAVRLAALIWRARVRVAGLSFALACARACVPPPTHTHDTHTHT